MLKKIYMLVAIMIFTPTMLNAAQIGGLAGTVGGQLLTITAQWGLVNRDVTINGSQKGDYDSRSFSLKGTYGVSDILDLYANLGYADIQNLDGHDDTTLGDLFGGGFKYLFFEGPESGVRFSISGDIQFLKSNSNGVSVDYQEISGAAIVSKNYGHLSPFAGVKFSDISIDIAGTETIKPEDNTGLFAGLDYFVNPNVYFTGEIHVFAENSIYVGAGYNF